MSSITLLYQLTLLAWLVPFGCNGMVSFYLPALTSNSQDREILIVSYFELGFSYKEILAFLTMYHGIQVSLRHLKRILSFHKCYRRINHSDIAEVVDVIERELIGSASDVGYRQIHQRLRRKCKLVVSRETV